MQQSFVGTPFMFDEPVVPTGGGASPAPQGALESTLELVKKSLWDVEHNTQQTQSRLAQDNTSGPTHFLKGISKWSAEDWALDMIGETLVEIQDTIENSAIARHSDSPLEKSLNNIRESTVTFNEKTLRWHDDQTNLMVKGSDPRVEAAKLKPEPLAVEKAIEDKMETKASIGLPYIADLLQMIHNAILITHNILLSKDSKATKPSAEEENETAVDDAKDDKRDKKRNSILTGMWENLKESGKKSWLADNWGKLLLGIGFLFAPLEFIKKLWEWTKIAWDFTEKHPFIAALLGLTFWFAGGALVKSLATAIGSGIIGLFGGGGAAAGGIGLIGKLFLGVKAAALGGLASPLAIVGALAMAIFDGFAGMLKSGDWGVGKISAFLGGMFSGSKGWVGMFANMGKWAVAGAVLGFPFFGIGAIPGGLVGAAIGAIFNFIGGKRMAQAFSNVGRIFKELLLLPTKLAKFLFKWIIVKPFTWLLKKIASTDVWKSMVADWSKGWNELVSNLTEIWDSFTYVFRVVGREIGKIWDWIVDPETIISGDLIMGLIDPIIEWFKDLFSFDFSMPSWDIGEGLKAAVRGIISGIPGFLVPDAIEEWAEGKGTEEKPKTKAEIVEEKKQEQKDIISEEEEKIKKSQLHMAGEGEDVYGPSLDNVLGLELVGQRQSLEAIEEATKALLKIRVDDRRARVSEAEKIASKTGKMSEEEYRKSARGIADRTDVDNNLIGMSKEEQAQLYEEYVGTRPKEGAEQISKPESALGQIVQSAKDQFGFGGKNKKVIQEAKDVAKKLIRSYDKHDAKGSRTKGLRHGVKQRMSGTLKSASPGARAAMVEELQGTALGDQMKKSFGDDFIAPDLREVKGAEGMATATGGLDMMSDDFVARTTKSSDAFTEQLSGGAEKRRNTFNSVMQKNQTLQDEKSGSPVIISNTTNANSSSSKSTSLIPMTTTVTAPKFRESNADVRR